ncbi:DUF4148 domain-containing protein [Pandoraea anhela]|uniref:DUF4148 domain-containing protein n=1 Tax=Pandoraea anhela TaxID=2508295 RepID=A0A5E4UCE8_9BURK|nr:DUF4148 domain-containing protein [Pandoraea anhela]VVD97222.1 hypothetical protein PAN31108_01933 [Pandoraea anhela]
MQKRIMLCAALGLMAVMSTAARADHLYGNEATTFAPANESRPDTREAVVAELTLAHAQGVPVPSSLKAIQATQSPSVKTRDQVYQELVEARRQGLMDQPDALYPSLTPRSAPN